MINERPSISVVIPVRNRPALVVGTLRSVMAQTLQPRAVIVVDNGSDDDTADAVRLAFRNWRTPGDQPVPELKLVSEPVPGPSVARNRGLAEVDTEWTMFFDSDDEMLPRHIERAMAVAEQNPDAEVVGWYVTHVDQEGRSSLKPFYSADSQYHNLFHASMATQRYMARTELFRRVGGWDDSLNIWEDIEIGARLIAQAPLIVKIAGLPTVVVRTNAESVTGPNYGSRFDLYEATLEAIARTLPRRKRHWVAMKSAILAADLARENDLRYADVLRHVLADTPGLYHRLVLRLVFLYRRHGGRGAARLMRPFV